MIHVQPSFSKNKLKCFREKNVFSATLQSLSQKSAFVFRSKGKVVETEVISCKKLRLITAKATAYRAFEKRAMTTFCHSP
ncbi:hypothetical protein GTI89_00125 [Enterococcus gallinarum]|uniref:Uncharacterized protein n=2 Tax=Enterococcus TaxID=1350 RepID=A0A6I4XLL3_ENTGA|nr:predicted protein [Enterococcus gallinarum EG2]MXS24500.1 hypothetical protein [Enterococcus gallinarum]